MKIRPVSPYSFVVWLYVVKKGLEIHIYTQGLYLFHTNMLYDSTLHKTEKLREPHKKYGKNFYYYKKLLFLIFFLYRIILSSSTGRNRPTVS